MNLEESSVWAIAGGREQGGRGQAPKTVEKNNGFKWIWLNLVQTPVMSMKKSNELALNDLK